MSKNLRASAPSREPSPKSASKSSTNSARPWESPQWEEAVRQTPGLQPFFDNLESFVELPEGVKKLRTLFLDLAVRGKLVDQHESEHDADYAERVIREVGELSKTVGTRRATKQKAPEIDPFPLPPTWSFVSVGTIGVTQTGTTPTKREPDNFGDFIPFIKPGDIQSTRVDYENEGLSEKGLASGRLVPACSVLMVSIGGSIGKAAVVEHDVSCNQQINTLTPPECVNSTFVSVAIRSSYFQRLITERAGTGTLPIISKAKWEVLPIPLPPLAEQRRIVSKVEGLMSLCDTLEDARRARESVRERASRSVLASLTGAPRSTSTSPKRQRVSPANDTSKKPSSTAEPLTQPTLVGEASPGYRVNTAETLASSWQRLSDHFEVLLDQPETVPHLRQSILQLAVQGKLVPQDPSGKPASAEDKDVKLPAIEAKEIPFDVPESWEWRRFGSVADFINGDRGKNYPNRNEYVKEGIAFMNTGHIEPDGSLCLNSMNYITREKFDSLRSGKIQPGDLVYCLRGATIGKTARVDPFTEGAIASSLVIIRLDETLDRDYAYTFLRSPLGCELITRFDNGSAQPNLGAKSLNLYVTPTPPLAEQKRIVSKVSALLSQCDELSARLRCRQSTTDALLTALIHQILNGADD